MDTLGAFVKYLSRFGRVLFGVGMTTSIYQFVHIETLDVIDGRRVMKLKDRQKLSRKLTVRELDRSTWHVQCEGGCAEVENHSIVVESGIAYHTVRLDRSHNIFVCDCPGGQYVCKHILAVVGVELRSVTHKIASFWLKEKDARRQRRPYFHLVAPLGELYTTMRRI